MPPAAPQGNQGDNSAAILWSVAAIFVAIGIIWVVFKVYIIAFYLGLKYYEAGLLSLIDPEQFIPVKDMISATLTNPSKVTFQDMVNIGGLIGEYVRFPITIILFILAFVVYIGNSTRIYKRNYNMQDLAKMEQSNWPQISPVTHLDLVHMDIDKGAWAMAMTPMQFCKRYKLLEERRPERREGMTRKEWDRIEVVLKRGEANKIFALQLGSLWHGTQHLPPYIKALFTIFAARTNADSKEAAKLILQLNRTAGKQMDFTGVDELCRKHEHTKLVQKVVESHAYVLTVMAAMLEAARDDGVQATADFLWLKPVDRRLWYMLNTVGRQTPFVEVAGVFAHFMAEKEAGRKLLVPMVEEASKAVEIALREVVYHPDEPAA